MSSDVQPGIAPEFHNAPSPRLTLSMDDKIYLALSRNDAATATYIFALFCRQTSPRNYNMAPSAEVYTFDNKRDADMFYNTLNKIMAVQSKLPAHKALSDFSREQIKMFPEHTK